MSYYTDCTFFLLSRLLYGLVFPFFSRVGFWGFSVSGTCLVFEWVWVPRMWDESCWFVFLDKPDWSVRRKILHWYEKCTNTTVNFPTVVRQGIYMVVFVCCVRVFSLLLLLLLLPFRCRCCAIILLYCYCYMYAMCLSHQQRHIENEKKKNNKIKEMVCVVCAPYVHITHNVHS